MSATPSSLRAFIVELTLEQLAKLGLEEAAATDLLPQLNQCLRSLPAAASWQKIARQILRPDHPFQLHEFLYQKVFAAWDWQQGPPPVWSPTQEQVQSSNIARLMRSLQLDSYPELHAWSVQHRAAFWERMIQELEIRFRRGYTEVVDLSAGIESPRWLVDAEFNIVESCFQAPDEATAVIFQAQGGPLSRWTYKALQQLTNRVAHGLVDAGFRPGDAIAIDLPMTAESVAIYLGIIAAGGVAVSIADSFAPHEIETRLRLAAAKAVFTQDYILRSGKRLPLYDKVVAAHAPRTIVLSVEGGTAALPLREGDVKWQDFLGAATAFTAVRRRPDDHLNILFSSGTTGEPKAIPWTQTTPIKCAVDGHLHHDIQQAEVVAWPTNLGWMMGPWLIYASLVNRATIALYYGVPSGRDFGRFVQDAQVNMLGVVPSLVRAWKSSGCMQGLDWGALKAYSSTGECSEPEDMLYLMALAGYRPIIEYCGGTEIGGGYIAGTLVQPAAPATFSTPALGVDFAILDEAGHPADNGEVFLHPPSIGFSTELLNRDHHEVYFAATPAASAGPLRRHGDQIEDLGGGYYRAHGRVDDTMNLSGIKVSSAEIEQVLNGVEGVRETAASGASPLEGGPSQLVIYAVVAPGVRAQALREALQDAIRQQLNPLFKIHEVVPVDQLPRTASNKVLRRVLRDRYRSEEN